MTRARASMYLWLALMLLCGSAWAQDAGAPDTVRVGKVTTNAGLKVGVPVTMFNDAGISGYSVGIVWNSPDVTLDSISYIGSRLPGTAFKIGNIDNINDQVLVGFADFTAVNPLTAGNGLVFTLWYSVAGGAPDQFVALDSAFVPPAGSLEFAPQIGNGFIPQFIKGEIKIGNPQPPAIIVLSQGTFNFAGQVGQGNPPTQIQNITNGGGQTLNWTAVKNSTWLVLNPLNGTAPTAMVVGVNTAALPAGSYSDTVTISAANASNSPQKFVVNLTMTIPPPTIKLTPKTLSFTALQNGPNPASQDFAITNIGLGTLNWTAAESIPWLSLSVGNGTAPSTVTVNIDITGLTAAVYKDSVAISDPTATNSPQYLVVNLEVFSAFPVIDPDPNSIFVVGSEFINPYNRTLLIQNNGGGVMNFSLTKTKTWLTLSANNGTATQGSPFAVTLSFNRLLVDFGLQFDTITITSGNAINSPIKVPVTFWKMETPQNMTVSTSALSFTTYECGSFPPVATQSFAVNALLSTPSLNWTLSYAATWLTATPATAPGSALVTVKVDPEGLAPGAYSDTIVVSSSYAIDPPKKVAISFTVLPTPVNKVLDVSRDSIVYIFKYTQLGSANQGVAVFNQLGGCVDYTVASTVPFLTPLPPSGTTTDSVFVRADPIGLSLGRHTGSVIFNSTTASNTPITLPVVVWVYTFGDANGDGRISIADASYLLEYIFNGGPAPVPIFITGDVDCSRAISIADVVYLINWIFNGGPAPCLY